MLHLIYMIHITYGFFTHTHSLLTHKLFRYPSLAPQICTSFLSSFSQLSHNVIGVKLSDASKKFGKKFATGASVVKGPTEKEQIGVQGDISFDVVDFITESWPDVPETAIYFIEDGKKVAAA